MLLSQVAISIFRVGSIIRVQFSGWKLGLNLAISQVCTPTLNKVIIIIIIIIIIILEVNYSAGQQFERQLCKGYLFGGQFPGQQFLGGNYPGANYPGEQLSGRRLSEEQLSGGNYPGGNCPGCNYPGDNCPVPETRSVKRISPEKYFSLKIVQKMMQVDQFQASFCFFKSFT